MVDTVELVRLANTRFYVALGQGDLAAMSSVWLHAGEAVCVHPGWPSIRGWAEIRKSWEAIFEHQGLLRVWPTEIRVRIVGDVAQVRCLENIDVTATAGGGVVQAQALNRFVNFKGRWRMLEHRTKPIPAFRSSAQVERFSTN